MSPLDVARTATAPSPASSRGPTAQLPLWARLAARELRTGPGGFGVFVACIALGVMVITAVGALSDALRAGVSSQGRAILGGDVTFVRPHARATAAEREGLARRGTVSESATLRTMARLTDGLDRTLAELKAVDGAYPLVGAVGVDGVASLAEAIGTPMTAAVEPSLLERLGLKLGDRLTVGDAELTIRARLVSEPDGLGDRATFGPRVLVSMATLERTRLIEPGALVRWRYALTVPEGREVTRATIEEVRAAVAQDLPEAGFTIADRFDPSPQLTRTLDRLREFLTLIGLTSLIVGGVGVANAVATFVDKRRTVIATLKSLGAPAGLVFRLFLAQIVAVAALGIAIGLVAGLAVPTAITALVGDALPIRIETTVTWASIGTAAAYGLLVAVMFALWPLGRAERVSPSVLFRDDVAGDATRPPRHILAAIGTVAILLTAFAVLSTELWGIALAFCGGLAVLLAVFAGVGHLVPILARRLPRPRRPSLAIARASIAAPGGLARAILLSLGLGLSLLVAVALIDASLQRELTGRLPDRSPSYFVLDIGKGDADRFRSFVEAEAPGSTLQVAPMLRGRLVALKGVPVERVTAGADAQWVLYGDRGLSFSTDVPPGSRVVEGAWWTADYRGEPLVSFEVDLARRLGLKIGDAVTVNVLGRNLTARIANLRQLAWESLNLNFVLVFSPNALEAAPYKLLATVTLPKTAAPATEIALARTMGTAFPATTQVRVKEAIARFNGILEKVLIAVRVAGGVTLLAGALVLAGALATAQRRRMKDAVILKALGATRGRILAAHLAEYLMLALVAAVFALAVGTLAAWIALTFVMDVPFAFSGLAVVQALGVAGALIVALGLLSTSAVLQTPPVPLLKSE